MIERLGVLANESLALWDLPPRSTARLINVSENATYLVEAPDGSKSILRIHREDYHTRNAIRCEHAWSEALDEEGGVHTPHIIPGRDGSTIQTASVDGLPGVRHMAMFEFVEGEHPEEDADHLVESFEELGEIAARTHNHSVAWARPENFERLVWDLDTVFGPSAYWGDWRDAPGMTPDIKTVLERLQSVVTDRLTAFGKAPDRFGLIHADMRLANLIISDGTTRLIDFDDCGLGWFMYDFAAGISFMEDHPQIPALKEAWVRGYRKARELRGADEHEIDTFVMLRRLALLAWIGTHIEVDTAKELAPSFAPVTAELADKFLSA
jgi:Ser/Thr protein kinase RdoA (MazF antagonist)